MNANKNKKLSSTRTNHIINDKTSFAVLEAYKAARTNLMFILGKRKENNANVVLFTSANQSEGKTTTCVNLAITVAQAGKRVLVIDADMRKPRIHTSFGVDVAPGLSDKLSGMNEQSCVYEISCGNLFVLPAGSIPPNPAELLGSEMMDELLRNASKEFDYVFIDTPPVGLVTDASVLCSKIAGAILVTRYNHTSVDDMKTACSQLEAVGGKVLGTVMNGKDMSTEGRYGKYGKYGKYGRYGSYGNK